MNTKQQGDIGVAKAIFYYTASGYIVSIPNTDNSKYDLVVDKLGTIYRVQVKTTTYKTEYGIYQAALKTMGGNRSGQKISNMSSDNIDLVFILTEEGSMYEIPATNIGSGASINLGKDKSIYLVSLDKW